MESTAFNQAGWNPLHLIGMHFTTLHGIYCIQSCCMEFTSFNWDPLHHDAWNPLRSIKIHCTTLHGIHCIESVSITSSGIEYISIIEIHCTTLHRIHCIQSRCMESTAFNRDPLGHTAWNPLHSLGIHLAMLHVMHCV